MLHDLFYGESLLFVWLQHFINEVDEFRGELLLDFPLNLFPEKLSLALNEVFVEWVFEIGICVYGGEPTDELKQNHSEGENIVGVWVIVLLVDKLRRHVADCAQQLVDPVTAKALAGEPEIDELNFEILIEQDILILDVPVDDSSAVEVLDRFGYLHEIEPCYLLRELALRSNQIVNHLLVGHKVEDEHIPETVHNLDDIFMVK